MIIFIHLFIINFKFIIFLLININFNRLFTTWEIFKVKSKLKRKTLKKKLFKFQ